MLGIVKKILKKAFKEMLKEDGNHSVNDLLRGPAYVFNGNTYAKSAYSDLVHHIAYRVTSACDIGLKPLLLFEQLLATKTDDADYYIGCMDCMSNGDLGVAFGELCDQAHDLETDETLKILAEKFAEKGIEFHDYQQDELLLERYYREVLLLADCQSRENLITIIAGTDEGRKYLNEHAEWLTSYLKVNLEVLVPKYAKEIIWREE